MNRQRILVNFGAGTLAVLLAVSPMSAFAATSASSSNNTATANDLADADIIDWSRTGSLTIHKYDITSAEAAGDYTEGERYANGQEDAGVEEAMEGYGIKGVQFAYLWTGSIELYNRTAGGNSDIQMVYEIPKELADILRLDPADAIDMTAAGVAKPCDSSRPHYTSTQLNDALEARLAEDRVGTTSDLEEYLYNYNTQDISSDDQMRNGAHHMPETDENGVTSVDGLELGLYLVVETDVPEQVTDLTNPFFASLPFTNLTPEDDQATGSEGGDYWLYDMTVYPKNETGNPTLDKSVRNAYSGTTDLADHNGTIRNGSTYDYSEADGSGSLVVWNDDTNAGNPDDTSNETYVANRGGYPSDGVTAGKDGAGYSTDFEYRDTQTASAGDVLDYILVSRLPAITSKGTFLSEYTFRDVLEKGITYNRDVKIAFYDNASDANANNTENAIEIWNLSDGDTHATAEYLDRQYTGNGSEVMTIRMTEAGLNRINGTGEGTGADADHGMSEKYMVVSYTATVNSDDSLVLGDEGNQNNVVLTWSRTHDGYTNTLEDRNYVYAYSLDLTKEFSDNKGDFSKVGFKLYNETDSYYVEAEYDEDASVYYVTGKNVDKDAATTFTPDADGRLVIYGLEGDTYGLTEITTDQGYTLLEDAVRIAITPTDREINASVAGTTGMDEEAIDAIVSHYAGGIYDENGDLVTESSNYIQPGEAARPAIETPNGRTIGKTDMFVGEIAPARATVDAVDADMLTQGESADATVGLSVTNHKNFTLPQTGGYGTLAFVLGGCVAALGGTFLISKKRKKKDVD